MAGVDEKTGKGKGTTIRFVPDQIIFKKITEFDSNMVKQKLRELSFLCKGLTIEFIDERNKDKEIFGSDDGISDFVLPPKNLF